ncbi:hypothetical protein SB768_08110 [Burkholderia sp. SIMBA_043]|uniref:hypothetical protein n=1 Tax=Burkholderia TaxID=32008 RepID=UPI0005DA4A29|nr:hypothetical protein [Burkholderia vietnamiensis]AJY05500.1 hypothetical protein AK36_2030 [Burkholderia vietnamiensis LMG 10929]UBI27567.1 hypothetical protein LA325_15405 [Burkholderia vietnamiensis]
MIVKHFESVPEFGIERYWHYDEHTDTATIENRQNHDPVLERNKQRFNSIDERTRWGDFTKVASIPLVIYQDLKAKGIADDPSALKKWLNDPENVYFRTRPGKV